MVSRPELSMLLRQVSANMQAGMPAGRAWENASEASPVPLLAHPALSTCVSDCVGPAAGLCAGPPEPKTTTSEPVTIAERRRQEASAKQKNGLSAWIERWWWPRSEEGRRHQRSLAMLYVAWDFVERVGAAPADILTVAADAIDHEARAAHARANAQAGPRASSRVLSALPLMGMAGAGIVGVNPWNFYLSSLVGALDLGVGLLLMVVGWLVSRHMVASARLVGTVEYDASFAMTLVQAGLESGVSIPRALDALGESMRVKALCGCAQALKEGRSWWQAWAPVPADFLPLAQVLQAAWQDGSAPVQLLKHGAELERHRIQRQVDIAHARLGVRLMLPLGLCYLPAFIVLGVIPVIAHIATKV